MIVRARFLSLVVSALMCSVATAQVTVQTEDNVLEDGSAFLWVEAENAIELGGGPPENAQSGFILVDKNNPIQTITMDGDGNEVVNGGRDVLPADTDASGGAAIFHQLGAGGNAKWQVQFAIPATYYLYMHYSFFNRDNNTNYSNEDSIYVPPSFNANSRSDWIGYEGVDGTFEEAKEGDSNRDGWMPLPKDVVSEGGIETHNSTDEEYWEGQFQWAWMDVAVDMDENDAFVGGFGHGIVYDVTDGDVGSVLDFEISTREQYGVIDGLLFSTSNELLEVFSQDQMDEFFLNMGGAELPGDFDGSGVLDLPDVNMLSEEISKGSNNADFDVTGDGNVNGDDLNVWVRDLRKTWFGDANLDDEFNSGDLVEVFGAGKYETAEAANWAEGDWNADLAFNSSDLVAAFGDGGYEMGPRTDANAIPEPSACLLWLIGVATIARWRRTIKSR